MSIVVIGMDPHNRSATIEVMDSDETVLGRGRYGTCPSGYRAMVRAVPLAAAGMGRRGMPGYRRACCPEAAR
jgi:hypothetical protein